MEYTVVKKLKEWEKKSERYVIRLQLIEWNGRKACLDLRTWHGTKPLHGIAFPLALVDDLMKALEEIKKGELG